MSSQPNTQATSKMHLRSLAAFLCVLVLTGSLSTCQAYIPPRPGSDLDVPAQGQNHVRRRLQTNTNNNKNNHHNNNQFQPQLLHPEACRDVSESECQDMDQAMLQNAQAHRRYLQQQQQPTTTTSTKKPVRKVLVLLLQWSDHTSRPLPPAYEYQILMNLRMARYLKVNSGGAYETWFQVIPWHVTDNTESFYSFGTSGRTPQLQQAFGPLLDHLDQDPTWNWKDYDVDRDGMLDGLMVLHSGFAAELGGVDCTNQRPSAQRLWSHASAATSQHPAWTSADGTMSTNAYVVASALHGTCDSHQPASMNITLHEYLHTLGLTDLYDTGIDATTGAATYLGNGVGSFDIMANPYGVNGMDDNFPTHLGAWSKAQLGWITPMVLNNPVEYQSNNNNNGSMTLTLRPSEFVPHDVYKIYLDPMYTEEYLLLENRQPREFDIHMMNWGASNDNNNDQPQPPPPTTGGLIVWHIDDQAQQQTQRGFPGQGNWPANAQHYQVAVVQADGEYQLEQGTNHGDVGDFFRPGMSLGPSTQPETNMNRKYPSTDTYSRRNGVASSGIVLQVLSLDPDTLDLTVNIHIPPRLRFTPPKESSGATTAPAAANSSTLGDQEPLISGKIPGPWMLEDPLYGATVNYRQAAGSSSASKETYDLYPPTVAGSSKEDHGSWLATACVVASTSILLLGVLLSLRLYMRREK